MPTLIPTSTSTPSVTFDNHDMTYQLWGSPTARPAGRPGRILPHVYGSLQGEPDHHGTAGGNHLQPHQGNGQGSCPSHSHRHPPRRQGDLLQTRVHDRSPPAIYTFCELTTHLRTTQARVKAPSAAVKQTAALFARQETKQISEIRSGAYTGPGSAQSLGAGGMDDASDLQGGEKHCKELLRRFYKHWNNTFDTVKKAVGLRAACDTGSTEHFPGPGTPREQPGSTKHKNKKRPPPWEGVGVGSAGGVDGWRRWRVV
jgi:hypothetical protein